MKYIKNASYNILKCYSAKKYIENAFTNVGRTAVNKFPTSRIHSVHRKFVLGAGAFHD